METKNKEAILWNVLFISALLAVTNSVLRNAHASDALFLITSNANQRTFQFNR